jgi:hypothetical protein
MRVSTGERVSVMSETQQHLEKVIARMQTIQRAIKSSGQPASMFELQELKDLGAEYAKIVDSLADASGDQSQA